MAALANEYGPIARESDSQLIDSSAALSQTSKFLRCAFKTFLKIDLRAAPEAFCSA